MVLGLGAALAALWAGPVLDAFGLRSLVGAAIGLALASAVATLAIVRRRRPAELSASRARVPAGGSPGRGRPAGR